MRMYDTETLTNLCESYMNHCNNRPTKKGLAQWLEISVATIQNYLRGTYNRTGIYTENPCATRRIANKDFGKIRSLFL